MSYEFYSYQLLLALTIILFTLYYIRLKVGLVSLPIVFNAYALLYFVFGQNFYYSSILDGYASWEFLEVVKLSVSSLFFFNLSFVIFYKCITPRERIHGYIPSRDLIYFSVALGLLAHVLLIALGGADFFSMGRVERFGVFKQYRIILLLSNLLILGMIFSFARYEITRDQKDYKLAMGVLYIVLIYSILTISRTNLTICVIVALFYFERTGIWSRSKIIIVLLATAIGLFFFKGVLYDLILGNDSYEKFNPGEFINWIRNSILILSSSYPEVYMPENSYLLTIKSLFNPSPAGQALSEWFIEYYYPERAMPGLTYGFSGVIEGYLYGGYLGSILHFSFIGALFAFISRSKSLMGGIILVCCLTLLFRLFRSEMYNFVKTITWYYLYQILLLFLIDKLVMHNRQRISKT